MARPVLASYIRELSLRLHIQTAVSTRASTRAIEPGRYIISTCTSLRLLSCQAAMLPDSEHLSKLQSLSIKVDEDASQESLTGLQNLFAIPARLPELVVNCMNGVVPRLAVEGIQQASVSAEYLMLYQWTSGCCGPYLTPGDLLDKLSTPPTKLALRRSGLKRVDWESLLDRHGADLPELDLHISSTGYSGEDGNQYHLPHVRLSDLEELPQLRSLTIRAIELHDGIIDVSTLPSSLKYLTLTWHMCSETFWEPLNQLLKKSDHLPILDFKVTPDWTFEGPAAWDANECIRSLKAELISVTGIWAKYQFSDGITKPEDLWMWWLDRILEALPPFLRNKWGRWYLAMMDGWNAEQDQRRALVEPPRTPSDLGCRSGGSTSVSTGNCSDQSSPVKPYMAERTVGTHRSW